MPSAHLLLYNARVITLDPSRPRASAVAIAGDRITAVGDQGLLRDCKGPGTRVVDCQGMALVPGFIDAHCHLLALASSLRAVDCRPERAPSIPAIQQHIRRRAAQTPAGQWVRAYGYDEAMLAEGRHPTRWDLDTAAPNHPVRLEHRSGHAAVLNSLGLKLVGIARESAAPPGGYIVRDEATGQPTGLLLEMGHWLSERLEAQVDEAEFLAGVREADRLLLSQGITSVVDASPNNGPERWRTFQGLKEAGCLTPRLTMMVGIQGWGELGPEGVYQDLALTLGPVKLMVTLATGELYPPRDELAAAILQVHRAGRQVAIHAVEMEAVDAAVEAIAHAQRAYPRPSARHRIEHASELSPALVQRIRDLGLVVVTQPGFIYYHGDRYLSLVEPPLHPYLYPVGTLARAGVPVAAGSDAPVAPPVPLVGIYASATRRTRSGQILAPEERVLALEALRMHTAGAAYACREEGFKGSLRPGMLADLALLNEDPTQVEPGAIREIRVAATVVGGRVVWQGNNSWV